MCGICGCIDFKKKVTREELITASNSMAHRGPDDAGTAFIETQAAYVGLGHRRLAVLDLTQQGHQPMFSEEKKVVIILNGEIYNFKEIRITLEEKGHHFFSNSDTEVVLKAYQQYGIDCLSRFIGMFSIAIYDANIQKVFLIRDRSGVKPLYYYFADGCLLFASELKAFHRFANFKKQIDEVAVSLFFTYGYIKAPYSIFKNTYKLQPGYFATIVIKDQSVQLTQYWNVLDYFEKPAMVIDENEAVDQLEALCTKAFKYRRVSDVPVGIFLSGGYDSALVAAILQKNSSGAIKTFTIGFKEDAYNEANYAKQLAKHLGTMHYEYDCTPKEAIELIPLIPYFYDEPFGDSSAIPTMLVSRFAKEQVTVALSADGGDELFAGYNRYDQLSCIHAVQQNLPHSLRKIAASVLLSLPGLSTKRKKIAGLLQTNDLLFASDLLSTHFVQGELGELLQFSPLSLTSLNEIDTIAGLGFINKLLAADYTTYLPGDILTKMDRASMSVGLEAREPLLDQKLVEWAAQLPISLKYKYGNKKYLLKQLTHKYLPKELMKRPKMGFGIPLEKWLKGDLKPLLLASVNEESLSKQNILNKKYVLQLMDDFFGGKVKEEKQVWLIFMFMLWWKQWM